jgi:serine/threonine protein kinase
MEEMGSDFLTEFELPDQITIKNVTIDIDKEQLLGKGSYVKVFRGRDSENNQDFAVKVYNFNDLKKPKIYKSEARQYILQEEKMMMSIDFEHPNIIKYLGLKEDKGEDIIYVVEEKCDETLSSFISSKQFQNTQNREAMVRELMIQIGK